jgi:hypothetical protein
MEAKKKTLKGSVSSSKFAFLMFLGFYIIKYSFCSFTGMIQASKRQQGHTWFSKTAFFVV